QLPVVVRVVGRDDHDRELWVLRPQIACHVEPAHVRKPDVEQDHVGIEPIDGSQRPGAVTGLTDDLPAVRLERAARGLAETLMVIDDEHAGRHPGHDDGSGRRGRGWKAVAWCRLSATESPSL